MNKYSISNKFFFCGFASNATRYNICMNAKMQTTKREKDEKEKTKTEKKKIRKTKESKITPQPKKKKSENKSVKVVKY